MSAPDIATNELSRRLEELRLKLLDLTARNKLLNFRHTATNSLRAVDELPGQLFQRLLDGRKLELDPLPKPTERELERYYDIETTAARVGATVPRGTAPTEEEWAQHLGISPRFELPVDTADLRDPKYNDDKIQTLLYPERLATRARKLHADARTAVEESGVNMLHLAFGFLEWREPAKANTAYLAPLILVPVELVKEPTAKGAFRYTVAWSGEDLRTNLTLQKKLLQDFALQLPDLDNDIEPEAYFDAVRKCARTQADWRVRRFVTLTMLNFGKQLLYLDLEPERWSRKKAEGNIVNGLSDSKLVRRLLLGDLAGALPDTSGAPPPDPRAIDLDLALVDRADSTQAAALLRALSGESITIQGPPGTGKSQTIGNLIAAALADGKSVLFVSEKLAALEVVKRRLDEMGFGPFCLELHSHKTRKQALSHDLAARLSLPLPFAPSKLQLKLQELTSERSKLEEYVHQIAEPVGALGWPASRILFAAGDARIQADGLPHLDARKVNLDALGVDEPAYAQALRELASLSDAANDLSSHPKDHPWCGVSSAAVMPYQRNRVIAAGQQWSATLDNLSAALDATRELLNLGDVGADRVDEITATILDALPMLARVDEAYGNAIQALDQVRTHLGLAFGKGVDGLRRLQATVALAKDAPRSALALRCPELCCDDVDEALIDLERFVARGCELRTPLKSASASRRQKMTDWRQRRQKTLLRSSKPRTSSGFSARSGARRGGWPGRTRA